MNRTIAGIDDPIFLYAILLVQIELLIKVLECR